MWVFVCVCVCMCVLVGVRIDAKYFSVVRVAKHTSWKAP